MRLPSLRISPKAFSYGLTGNTKRGFLFVCESGAVGNTEGRMARSTDRIKTGHTGDTMKKRIAGIVAMTTALLGVSAMTGCMTATHRFAEGEARNTVAGFAEEDISDTVSRAVQSVCSQDRIKVQPGANRAVMIIENITNDTLSRGRDAGALAEALGQSLREELTNGGKVVVYNKEAAQFAKVRIDPQYRLAGRLTERNLRQDNGDVQKEYNLNLTLVDLATGLEFWQKRVHVGKLVDGSNAMN